MAASCYLCAKRCDEIPGQVAGDAVGVCKYCGVLACLAHGWRNGNAPAYVCGVCVPTLLTAAATRRLGPDVASPDLDQWARNVDVVSDVVPDFDGDHWASVRGDAAFLAGQLDKRGAPEALQTLGSRMNLRERQLMAAAIAIAVRLRLPAGDMTPTLREVVTAMRRHA